MVKKLIEGVKLNNIFYKYVNCYNTEVIVVKDDSCEVHDEEWLLDNNDLFRAWYLKQERCIYE